MRLADLAALYVIAGTASAIALYRRAPERGSARVWSALAAVPLWPIWAPIAWTAVHEPPPSAAGSSDRLQTLRCALEDVALCVAQTPLESVLSRDATQTILGEAERVVTRNAELVRLLARQEFHLGSAEAQLAALEHKSASSRVQASARLHLENVRRLHQLAARDEKALEELESLVTALRTELMVVMLSGSSAAGVDDIVNDLWAHIEGLRSTHAAPHPHA